MQNLASFCLIAFFFFCLIVYYQNVILDKLRRNCLKWWILSETKPFLKNKSEIQFFCLKLSFLAWNLIILISDKKHFLINLLENHEFLAKIADFCL